MYLILLSVLLYDILFTEGNTLFLVIIYRGVFGNKAMGMVVDGGEVLIVFLCLCVCFLGFTHGLLIV